MASEKQIEANRRNALKGTGPRTQKSKARSQMNAFRHSFASVTKVPGANIRDLSSRESDAAVAYECVNAVDLARSKILSEIDRLLQQPPSLYIKPSGGISVYDGASLLGTVMTNSDGTWSFTTGTVSSAAHTYTVTATDAAGNVGNGSNAAMLGSTGTNTLVGTSGSDIIVGNGSSNQITGGGGADMLTASSGSDTFIFKVIADSTPASHDTIVNFNPAGDTIQFTGIAGINSTGGIATFQGQLAGSGNLTLNAHSVGYIEVGGNTEVLVNTTNSAQTVTASDVHTASMEIVLAGTHLGLTSSDFHIV